MGVGVAVDVAVASCECDGEEREAKAGWQKVLISQCAGAKERQINSDREINVRACQAAATITVGALFRDSGDSRDFGGDSRDFGGDRWLEGRGRSR